MMYAYLLVNVCSVFVPFLYSFHSRIRFDKNFNSFVKANVIASLVFIIWDSLFTAKGVWSFNPNYTLGLHILNLPVEEVMFFICIPFSCLFSFHCLRQFYQLDWKPSIQRYFVSIASLLLLGIGLFFIDQIYTSVTFISTALLLLVLEYYFKVTWLSAFFSVYVFLLLPFFIVNGILTGTGLEQPVVLYNDEENMGIRLLTIPVEDVVYGIEMLLLNIFLYERFQSGKKEQS